VHAEKVLVLAPHPDDDVFGCGALLAHLAENKTSIKVLYFCDGSLGNSKGEHDTSLVARREIEAVNALKEIGITKADFLRHSDLSLEKNDRLWEKIYQEIVVTKPDLVLVPDSHDWNSDHVAIYKSLVITLGKIKHSGPNVWAYFVWGICKPTYLFPYNKKIESIKKAAMACHKSQLKVRKYNKAILGMNEYLDEMMGLGHLAEGFREIVY
jgi:LmbE family N-acetylglucosaminyl deacetylase